jgi:hypothetical protein
LQFERLGRIGNVVVMAGFAIGATAWALEMSVRSVAFAFWINWALMGLAFATWLMAPLRFGRASIIGFLRSSVPAACMSVSEFANSSGSFVVWGS